MEERKSSTSGLIDLFQYFKENIPQDNTLSSYIIRELFPNSSTDDDMIEIITDAKEFLRTIPDAKRVWVDCTQIIIKCRKRDFLSFYSEKENLINDDMSITALNTKDIYSFLCQLKLEDKYYEIVFEELPRYIVIDGLGKTFNDAKENLKIKLSSARICRAVKDAVITFNSSAVDKREALAFAYQLSIAQREDIDLSISFKSEKMAPLVQLKITFWDEIAA